MPIVTLKKHEAQDDTGDMAIIMVQRVDASFGFVIADFRPYLSDDVY